MSRTQCLQKEGPASLGKIQFLNSFGSNLSLGITWNWRKDTFEKSWNVYFNEDLLQELKNLGIFFKVFFF